MLDRVGVWIVLALPAGLVVALVVLRPVLPSVRKTWPGMIAAGIAIALLLPVLVTLIRQTNYFRQRHMTEVGSIAFEQPPLSEQAVRAMRSQLHPGDTWGIVTPKGWCQQDFYAFYWLAFRLVPNVPHCEGADVNLFWKVQPPPRFTPLVRGGTFTVTR